MCPVAIAYSFLQYSFPAGLTTDGSVAVMPFEWQWKYVRFTSCYANVCYVYGVRRLILPFGSLYVEENTLTVFLPGLALHKAWPKLLRRMKANKASDEDQELVIASRTWFCLYLFEHQFVSYTINFQPVPECITDFPTVLVGRPFSKMTKVSGNVGY
jgi:hypothetical protein